MVKFSIISLFVLSLLVSQSKTYNYNKQKTNLIQLHVLFRHGNRTANGPDELYPNDPYGNYTYPPFGLGQLTNAGKKREYSIGKALRNRYNKFLGVYYTPEMVEPTSTDFNRTKMSLQLVLASLFPPRNIQQWNYALEWQPVPYNYHPRSQDRVLMGVECPNYLKLYNQQKKSSKWQAKFNEHKMVFDYISQHTGLDVTSFGDIYNLNFGLTTEFEWGFSLPNWTHSVWPKTITELSVQEYYFATATTEMKTMASGYLLQKIIGDIEKKVNTENDNRKIILYSAHENNLADLLLTLDIFNSPHIPTYGSYIVFEVLEINGHPAIKIYYENYSTNKPQLLKLPACDEICPLQQFISLVEEYLPKGNVCGN